MIVSGQVGKGIRLRRLLRIEEVAEVLDVSRARAYELARTGILPVVRVGRQVRIDPDRFREWIDSGGGLAPADPAGDPQFKVEAGGKDPTDL